MNEEEISRLKNQLNKSRRRLKVVGTVSVILIVILLLGCFLWNQKRVETSKFYFYYAARSKQRYGVDDLESYLNRWQWSEGAYVRGKFDCGEMSAYIEWRLENEGYNTIIVVGQAPPKPEVRHAWLLVETSSGKFMPVEATQYELVKWDNPYFDEYFSYDHSFETIFEALDYDYDSYNWWES